MPCKWCHEMVSSCTSGAALEENVDSHTTADLEADIISIENMMERLARRRTTLRRKINSLSFTARLPPELLTEIFRLTCQLSEGGGRLITPLYFGSICKEWREIAWSTPLLWNSVSLHLSRTIHASQIQLLTDWLMRANSSPLYIKLTSNDEHEAIFNSLRTIMDTLVVRSMYWYSLDCLLPLQCHDLLKDHHFPMLRSVSVHPPKGSISTFSEPPNMFLSAPKLLDVDLSGYNFSAMVLPWDQLRRFKTQFLTVAECLKILRGSSNLKECHLDSVYSPEIIPSPVTDPLYSDLETLDVALIKGPAISLLHSVTLPSLRELRVNYSGAGGFLISAITSLVLRSGCYLQRLCIEKHNFRDVDLIACLETLPSLTHLRLNSISDGTQTSMGLTDKLVSMLDPFRQSPPLIPNLTSFEYRGHVLCDMRSLLTLFLNRHRPFSTDAPPSVACLSVVDVTSISQYDNSLDIEVTLSHLREAGMAININCIDGSMNAHLRGRTTL